MREDFSAFKLPDLVREAYPPDRDGLFALIASQTTDAMLRVIAKCDYGQEADAHFEALLKIRAGDTSPIGWMPGEVLSLFCWSSSKDQKDFKDLRDFHIARAFCAVSLLRVPDEYENRDNFSNDSVLPLLASSLDLGEEYRVLFVRQLVAILDEIEPWDIEFMYCSFALFAVHVLQDGEPDMAVQEALGDWVYRTHQQALPWHSEFSLPGSTCFLDVRYQSVSGAKWRELARRVLDRTSGTGGIHALLRELGGPVPIPKQVERAKSNLRDAINIIRVVKGERASSKLQDIITVVRWMWISRKF